MKKKDMNTPNPKKAGPPQWATRFFRWFCNDHLSEAVLGDLEELYARRRPLLGKRKADLLFVMNVLLFLQPFAIKKRSSTPVNQLAMFENYFKIAWRTMSRQRLYTGIKIGGLAIAIGTCILITLFVRRELTYDQHYQKGDLVYRVYRESNLHGETERGIYFPAPFAKALQDEYPEIELAGHYNPSANAVDAGNTVRRGDEIESTHEDGFVYADQGLADIFELPFLRGNAQKALLEPNTLVITKRIADKYFANDDPIGKTLILNDDETQPYSISGVVQNPAATTHFQFNFLISLAGKEFWKGEKTAWMSSNYLDYIRVRPGTDVAALEEKMDALIGKYFVPSAAESGDDRSLMAWVKSLHFKLQPVQDIHLNTMSVGDNLTHGDVRYAWLFGAIAFFILTIACINFINLSTARSAHRAKEVGLRKVVGSPRSQLVNQFLIESLVFSFISFALGLALARTALPSFNTLLASPLTFPWEAWWFIPLLFLGAVLIGFVAGIYPSFYLSSFKPVDVLKGHTTLGARSSIRSLLVVFQFSISIILIVATLVIQQQMHFILHKKLGFNKDQVLILQDTHTLGDRIVTFKNELLQLPNIKHATISGFLPLEGADRNGNPFWADGEKEPEEGVGAQIWSVDHDYLPTLGIDLVAGRNFNVEMASDSQAVIINQTMANALNLKDPTGRAIVNPWKQKWNVIGIMEDFHFETLKKQIEPLCVVIGRSSNVVMVKIDSKHPQDAIESISGLWKKFSPHQAIRYTFLDQRYAAMYEEVHRTQQIFTGFAALAILLACLGLFALSAFLAEQRSKEISIRLVLGATAGSIFQLLTRNFMTLLCIALVIATPLSWYMMQRWLEDYVYKISISWSTFAIAGLVAVAIALFTVSYHTIRAALANPANRLRSE
ncbi:ABC transporter permease [Chryseolinea serpens]|nr:FtsX-like permease family protein [Chryseolinea serpens]